MSVHERLGGDSTIINGVTKVNIIRGAAKDERGRCRQSESRGTRDRDKKGAKGKWKKRGGSQQNVTPWILTQVRLNLQALKSVKASSRYTGSNPDRWGTH